MIQNTTQVIDRIFYLEDSEVKGLVLKVVDNMFRGSFMGIEKRAIEIECNNKTLNIVREGFDELKGSHGVNVLTAFVNGIGHVSVKQNNDYPDNKIIVWNRTGDKIAINQKYVYVQDVLDGVEICKYQSFDENYKPAW